MARYAVAYVDIAGGFELDVVAACVIGGVSIAGGIGSVAGAVMGALFLGVIKNALPVVDISPFWQLAISGTAIIVAVAFNARAERTQGPGHPQVGGACGMTHVTDARRVVPDRMQGSAASLLKSWEVLLLAVAVAIFVVNSLASPYFLERLEPLGRDLQLHREGDDRLPDGAPDHRRRDRPLGRGDHRAGLDRHGLRGAARGRHAGARR